MIARVEYMFEKENKSVVQIASEFNMDVNDLLDMLFEHYFGE